jgi:hypothetical protein
MGRVGCFTLRCDPLGHILFHVFQEVAMCDLHMPSEVTGTVFGPVGGGRLTYEVKHISTGTKYAGHILCCVTEGRGVMFG